MVRKLRIVPGRLTRSSAVLVAILTLGFLIFGVALLTGTDSDSEAEPFKLAFLAIWVVACVGIFIHAIRVFFAKDGTDTILEVEADAPPDDFDVRLRKLEQLRAGRLINEEEYQRKRSEIIAEKW